MGRSLLRALRRDRSPERIRSYVGNHFPVDRIESFSSTAPPREMGQVEDGTLLNREIRDFEQWLDGLAG